MEVTYASRVLGFILEDTGILLESSAALENILRVFFCYEYDLYPSLIHTPTVLLWFLILAMGKKCLIDGRKKQIQDTVLKG